jgi:hypothetical protein
MSCGLSLASCVSSTWLLLARRDNKLVAAFYTHSSHTLYGWQAVEAREASWARRRTRIWQNGPACGDSGSKPPSSHRWSCSRHRPSQLSLLYASWVHACTIRPWIGRIRPLSELSGSSSPTSVCTAKGHRTAANVKKMSSHLSLIDGSWMLDSER